MIDTSAVVKGERGKDLVLTIDMVFQKQLDSIVMEELKATKNHSPYLNRYLEDAMAIAVKPKTGEILAMSGAHYDRKKQKYENADYKVMYDTHQPGSVVKGATILTGLQSGVIQPGTTFYDEPVKIAGTPAKKSWKPYGLGTVNDIQALKVSSNVYMFYIAMRMGGEYHYQPNKKISFQPEAVTDMRHSFSQFGLGVQTGVDFPYEAIGYRGEHPKAGNLLDFAIGNYDTFTTLQLAQYVSTIANDGYRVRPHFLKEVREPAAEGNEPGPMRRSIPADILNKIQMDDKYIKRVQEGFRQVAQAPDGTANKYFNTKPYTSYNIAAKTGTAESEIYENGKKAADTENHSLVAYAPMDDPEIAIAVLVPNSGVGMGYPDNGNIAKRTLKAYFDLQESSSKN
ncbi:penicillin-binding transpeptidase domain-containing protein [Virgibacillus sp. 179-BFC.A HS]|uniref:Penicillin-binding transpeptidase domain-containing protein n=1 Tax=Tigheibacillus jepli TaxID=3035914 RepID=A0ABU5CFW5_9BACI|nr:penicillin-binding transpeptidase domain-containing protein [Virgibacillus sp. 179-BFC.A HS]MDY0404772.1 penicillin-binding transpeptidase domain-containing protein [Virgibacillus sp. 179-BFC.A HS]